MWSMKIKNISWADVRVKLHSQVHFKSKKILGPKKCWVQKRFNSKNFLDENFIDTFYWLQIALENGVWLWRWPNLWILWGVKIILAEKILKMLHYNRDICNMNIFVWNVFNDIFQTPPTPILGSRVIDTGPLQSWI